MLLGYNPVLGGGGLTQITMDLSTNGPLNMKEFIVAGGFQSPQSGSDFIQPSIVANQLQLLRLGGTGNSVGPLTLFPRRILNDSVNGLGQFAQARIISITTIGSSLGPGVMLSGNWVGRDGNVNADGGNGYFVTPSTAAFPGNVFVRRATITGTVLATVAGFAFNDLIRLEVLPNTPVVGQFTLRLIQNGILVNTTVDNAGTPPEPQAAQGWPGFFIDAIPIPTNSQQTWDQIKWGTL